MRNLQPVAVEHRLVHDCDQRPNVLRAMLHERAAAISEELTTNPTTNPTTTTQSINSNHEETYQ